MHFPVWIDHGKNDLARAQCRLKYMLNRVGLEVFGCTTMRGLAKKVGIDHSSLHNACTRGYFTEPMATQIEEAVGRKHLRREYLCKPLEIKAMEKTPA